MISRATPPPSGHIYTLASGIIKTPHQSPLYHIHILNNIAKMPALITQLQWNVGSDDFVLPALVAVIVRVIW